MGDSGVGRRHVAIAGAAGSVRARGEWADLYCCDRGLGVGPKNESWGQISVRRCGDRSVDLQSRCQRPSAGHEAKHRRTVARRWAHVRIVERPDLFRRRDGGWSRVGVSVAQQHQTVGCTRPDRTVRWGRELVRLAFSCRHRPRMRRWFSCVSSTMAGRYRSRGDVSRGGRRVNVGRELAD